MLNDMEVEWLKHWGVIVEDGTVIYQGSVVSHYPERLHKLLVKVVNEVRQTIQAKYRRTESPTIIHDMGQ